MYAKDRREEHVVEIEEILDEVKGLWGENPWELQSRAEIAMIRGDLHTARALRERAFELDPRPSDHPKILFARAIHLVDDGDKRGAVALLGRAADPPLATHQAHCYLAVLLEESDPERAHQHRSIGEQKWRDSAEGFNRHFEFVRRRVNDGPYWDLVPDRG
jgi:hypothetical protein